MSFIDSAVNNTASSAGGGMWGNLSTGQKWGVGGALVGSVLPALFGGGDSGAGDALRQLQKSTDRSLDTSKSLSGDSKDLFASVLPYLKAVAGGDRQAILGATMPERKRVIDQYSSARKAIAEFSPRSGGQAASMIGLNNNEASDLSMVGANAHTAGIDSAANLAGSLQGQAQTAENSANQNILNMYGIKSQQSQQSAQAAGQWGQALGTLSMLAFL